jgi:hypothetical protein
MRIVDEAAWQALSKDFAADSSPQAPLLHELIIAWGDAAEELLDGLRNSYSGERLLTPIEALRRTLGGVEVGLGSERISIGAIGAALVLLSMHWEEGESLYDDMTRFEQRLVEDTTLLKIMQLNAQAEEAR